MDQEKLRIKLIAAARLDAPAETVPYAFEKRIMARLNERKPGAQVASWFGALWGAAACSAAIAVLAGVWTLVPLSGKSKSGDLAQDFETTVFAMADEASESW